MALVAVLTLSWRWRYLATALVLGPMTWLRPVAAVAAGMAGALETSDWGARADVLLCVVAVLLVEPLVGVACRTAVGVGQDEEPGI